MGKLIKYGLVGAEHDKDPEYTFEHGTLSDLGLKFTEVACPVSKGSGCLFCNELKGSKNLIPTKGGNRKRRVSKRGRRQSRRRLR